MRDSQKVMRDALNHRDPGRVPLDINGTVCTGIHTSCVEQLREYYGLKKRPVRMFETLMALGYVEDDLAEAMGLDTKIIMPANTIYDNPTYPLEAWKEWRTPWGQTVLVPGTFTTKENADGDFMIYAGGDTSYPPAGRMPKSSYFFDLEIRQPPVDDDNLNPDDNLEEFKLLTPAALDFIEQSVDAAYRECNGRAVTGGSLPGTYLGDIALVPGPMLKQPKGIRDFEEWYISLAARREYLREMFAKQVEIAIANMKLIHDRIGDRYEAVFTCGTDYGTQTSTFCSADSLRDLQLPFYKKINDWIHANTSWKSMKHSCGAIEPLIDVFIEAGFDILNPVQCSASGMDPATLKKKYGAKMVFWGGGVDTQKTLPFGSKDDVRREVLERCKIFSPGGGFIFAAVHNIQALTPVENIVAMVDAVHEFNGTKR